MPSSPSPLPLPATATAAEVMRSYREVALAGDFERAYAHFAPDIRFRIPGSGPWAGEHVGREQAIAYIENARAVVHGSGDVELELIDVLEGVERVALLVRERFHTAAGPVDIRRANVYRVIDGQIVEIWIYEADQAAVDRLLG